MLALLQSRASLLIRGDLDGVGLNNNLSRLRDCFFGGFGGDESSDLLQGSDSGFELGLWDAAVGLVQEGRLVVWRVDVAENGAG